jgi:phosphoribosylpyrophosphate synthetase
MPCFPYARQPDASFDNFNGRNSISLRMRFSSTDEGLPGPVIRQAPPSPRAELRDENKIATFSVSQPKLMLHDLKPVLLNASAPGNGYRHWMARSGTLIANMIVASGIFKRNSWSRGRSYHYDGLA